VVWIDDLAAALGLEPMSSQERRLVLDVARLVAHRTERVNAPLASFLIGRYATSGRSEALRTAARIAEASLPPAAQEPGR
jgi:Domain of unknown function (DUF6457)